jgi:quercetin dioxygenase-like cupin family protein
MKSVIPAVLAALAVAAPALSQTAGKAPKPGAKKHTVSGPAAGSADHGLFRPGDLKWMDAPNALPARAKLSVLEGDPFKPGLYTMRLQMPDGYKIPPHFHRQFEHVTVVSGTFNLGMGDKFDQGAGQAMPAGAFGFLPPEMKHYAWAKGETVVQLHGMGPWEIVYVNTADDPRTKKD